MHKKVWGAWEGVFLSTENILIALLETISYCTFVEKTKQCSRITKFKSILRLLQFPWAKGHSCYVDDY